VLLENGPCPLVAIGKETIYLTVITYVWTLTSILVKGNVLLLRGDIQISPFDRPSVTFEYLASQLGNYLLSGSPSASKVFFFQICIGNI
jgi:hypothetical protein